MKKNIKKSINILYSKSNFSPHTNYMLKKSYNLSLYWKAEWKSNTQGQILTLFQRGFFIASGFHENRGFYLKSLMTVLAKIKRYWETAISWKPDEIRMSRELIASSFPFTSMKWVNPTPFDLPRSKILTLRLRNQITTSSMTLKK